MTGLDAHHPTHMYVCIPTVTTGARRVGAAARPISTAAGNNVYRTLYQNVFKSNIAYLTYVFAGAIALEWVYSKGIDTAWEISNSGVRFPAYDWGNWGVG